jgi:hypothetical protein
VRAAGPFAFELSGDRRAAALAWEEMRGIARRLCMAAVSTRARSASWSTES